MVRNLQWHTKWILDTNGGENAAELREIKSSDIPLRNKRYQSLDVRADALRV